MLLECWQRLGSLKAVAAELGISRQRVWQILNPEKHAAHEAVKGALRSGALTRSGSCDECGHRGETEAHHDDYSQPLVVRWLCTPCHAQRSVIPRVAVPAGRPAGPAMLTYDPEADALRVALVPEAMHARTAQLARGVLAHFDAADRFVELEVLQASDYYPRTLLAGLTSPAAYLTLTEAARESGLAAATLRLQINKGRIPAVKRGRDWLVETADLWNYLDNRAPAGRPAKAKKGRRRRKVAAA